MSILDELGILTPLTAQEIDAAGGDPTARALATSTFRLSSKTFGLVSGVGANPAANAVALTNILLSGIPVSLEQNTVYKHNAVSVADAPNINIDLNGSDLINGDTTARGIVVSYPYQSVVAVSSVNLAGKTVNIASTASYSVGDRVKLVSADRAPGNRPAPVDGSNYWQAQTLTVSSKTATSLTFRESFEPDFTFATSPMIMRYRDRSFKMSNGRIYSDPGFASTRSNGLVRINGGRNHSLSDIATPNANATAFEFIGCDVAGVFKTVIENVGKITDTEGSHGVSFVACVNPKLINCDQRNVRHSSTNNDNATQWSAANYYTMGPCYGMIWSGCTDSGSTESSFSTHHGLRGATISDCTSKGAIGAAFSVRGFNVHVVNCYAEDCDKGFFVFSEDDVADVDKTRGVKLSGNRSISVKSYDFQLQRGECYLGDNWFHGNAPQGWFLNNGVKLTITGNVSFKSGAVLPTGGNFLSNSGTPILNDGRIIAECQTMTPSGTNRLLSNVGADFVSNGELILSCPAISGAAIRQNTSGNVVVRNMLYSGAALATDMAGATSYRIKFSNEDGTVASSYFVQAVTANLSLDLKGALDPQVSVTLTGTALFALTSISSGQFVGQRLLIRCIVSAGFTFNSGLSNVDLRGGGNITMQNLEVYSFVWSGLRWVVESRAYRASLTYNWPSIAPGTSLTTTVTLTGASLGDKCSAAMSSGSGGLILFGEGSATDTVKVTAFNPTAAAIDLASDVLTVCINGKN